MKQPEHEGMTGALKHDDTFRGNQVFVSHTGFLICLLCTLKYSSVYAYHCKDKWRKRLSYRHTEVFLFIFWKEHRSPLCSFICDIQYLPFCPLGNPVGNTKTHARFCLMQELSESSNIKPVINHILKRKKQLLQVLFAALLLQGKLRLTPSSSMKIGGEKSFQITQLWPTHLRCTT